jgi:hypothetical protein
MRLIVSLLTAALFVAAAQATPAPKPSTIDIIKQPSLLRQKLAGNCTTTCRWVGHQQVCNTWCF